MKTEEQINEAKSVICGKIATGKLTASQTVVFQGMLTALNWVIENPNGSTLTDLINRRPMTFEK